MTPSAHPSFVGRTATALLLVDHQVGLLSGVRDVRTADLKANLVGLVKACQVLGVPPLDSKSRSCARIGADARNPGSAASSAS